VYFIICRQLLVKVGLMMPKGGEMHLRMPFLLIWRGNKLLAWH